MSGLPLVCCPACQTRMGLEALLGADDARGVLTALAAMPGPPLLRKSAMRYVGLFAPATQSLRWDRAERLLGELVAMMDAGKIERGGRLWPAPQDYWLQAIDAIFAMPTLRRPLKNHNLLLEILSGLSGKAEASAEARREAGRAGHTQTGGSAPRAQQQPEPEVPRARAETIAATLAAAKTIVGAPAK